jgi:hypothetical protein
MTDSEFSKKHHQHFFAKTIDCGIQASFSNAQGRKNYHIPKSEQTKEESPLAIESFAIAPEQYHALMERINGLYD